MSKKIVILHHQSEEELFPLLSLVIGFCKAYPGCSIIWAGDSEFSELVKYNKRIKRFLNINREFDLKTLEVVFDTDICVNVSSTSFARQFASNVQAKSTYGFCRDGPVNHSAEFFHNVMSGNLTTKKTVLQMFYDLAELRWKGEGYGLNYYPKTKQTEKCGIFAHDEQVCQDECTRNKIPDDILKRLNAVNRFSSIITDDLLTAHSSIALRKHCTFFGELPYRMEFFGKGTMKPFGK